MERRKACACRKARAPRPKRGSGWRRLAALRLPRCACRVHPICAAESARGSGNAGVPGAFANNTGGEACAKFRAAPKPELRCLTFKSGLRCDEDFPRLSQVCGKAGPPHPARGRAPASPPQRGEVTGGAAVARSLIPGAARHESGALQTRDRYRPCFWNGPGSAAHCCALRRAPDTIEFFGRARRARRSRRPAYGALPPASPSFASCARKAAARCW